jgi:thiamine pyrophosphokinase
VDHALANVGLLAMPELARVDVALYDGLTRLWLVRTALALDGAAGDIVSLLAWGGDAIGVTLSGLAYPLTGARLPLGGARGISNVMLGARATVEVRGGALLVAHTPLADLEANRGD